MTSRKSKNTVIENYYIFICLIIFIASIVYELPLYAETPSDGWKIEMHATRTDIIDQGRLIIGASSTSSNGYDIYDDEHPPKFPNRYLDLFTNHNQAEAGWENQKLQDMKYRAEFGAPLSHDGRVIDFYSETDHSGSITLSWTITDDIQSPAYYMKLKDISTGTIIYMREQSSYIANVQAGQHHFQLELTYGRQAPPVANNQSVTTAEDAPVAITLTATDPNEDPLTYSIVTQPAHGSLSGTPPDISYTPAAYYYGTDSFTFKANDGQADSNIAIITITVTKVNHAPVAQNQSVAALEDTPLSITLVATDIDDDPLTYIISTPPSHGVLSGIAPNVIYTPALNYNGADSFSFQANDGHLDSNVATVTIAIAAVNDPPVANNQLIAANEDIPVNILLTATDPEAGPITFSIVTGPTHGTLAGSPPNITYTPVLNYNGADSFSFKANDGQLNSNIATVSIAIAPVNDAPVANNQAVSTDEDTQLDFTLAGTDVDGDPLTYQLISMPSHGALSGNAPDIIYISELNYYGTDSFTYKVNDGQLDSNTGTVSIIIRSVNDLPTARFTVPGVGRNVSTWKNNLGSYYEGAEIALFSSKYSDSYTPYNAIDDNVSTLWMSASGSNHNQFIIVMLPGNKVHTIDRVRLINSVDAKAVQNFKILVSSTTLDNDAFTTVVTDIAQRNNRIQEFIFSHPVSAKYVQLYAQDNYGDSCCIAVSGFEIIDSSLSGVPSNASYSSYSDVNYRVELMLDNNPYTYWLSENGKVTNQFITLQLAEGQGQLIERIRILSDTAAGDQSLKEFELLVSATTDQDSAFVSVLSGTALKNGALQEFVIPGGPVRARYIKLLAKNNYGSASYIRISTLEIIASETEGNIISIPGKLNVVRNESPAQIANGASVVRYSSAYDSNTTPAAMLDYLYGQPWRTQTTVDQFAVIKLAGDAGYTLTGIQVSPRTDGAINESVKDFEIWISNTTSNDGAFVRVLQETVQNNNTVQTFLFPSGTVHAKYVKYVPLNNYGNPSTPYISTSNFDVIAQEAGGIRGYSSQAGVSYYRAEFAIDGSSSYWQTTGTTNEWIKILLSGGAMQKIYGVRIQPFSAYGPKDFDIRVSTTTADDTAFSTVYSGTLAQSGTMQEFKFDAVVDAKYVQFYWKNGYYSNIGVAELEVLGASATSAMIAGVSSQYSSNIVDLALDFDPNGYWMTDYYQISNQWVKLLLPEARNWIIDHVALKSAAAGDAASPRNFEIQVSTTTAKDTAFATIFSGALRNDATIQHFYFPPVEARYVKLLIKNNYGSPYYIVTPVFWIFSPQWGSMAVRFIDRSFDIDGTIVAYHWDFGDGAIGTERDPAHTYAAPGIYNVTLTTTDNDNGSGTYSLLYHASGPPHADFTYSPVSPVEAQYIQFTDASAGSFYKIVYREWNWGDGAVTTTAQQSYSHLFNDNGTYNVTLKASDERGISNTITKAITVANVAPTADSGPNQTILWGRNCQMAPYVFDVSPVDWQSLKCVWDFGDGQTMQINNCTSSNAAITHAYSNPGIYTATLTVTDKDGGTASDSSTITVNKRETFVNIYKALQANPSGQVEVAARLWDRSYPDTSMQNKLITFTFASQTIIVPVDARGIATALLTFQPGAENTVSASYAEDQFYHSSSDTDIFNAASTPLEIPIIKQDHSEGIAFVPNDGGRSNYGGYLPTYGFSGAYAPFFQNIDPFAIGNANQIDVFAGFDTAVLNGMSDIGSNNFLGNPVFRGRLEAFVRSGGKLIIWDSECQSTDYSKFFFPFTTNNPGAQGANGLLQIIEENTLSSNNTNSLSFIDVAKIGTQTDAAGDANVFLTYDPNWCIDMKARNTVIPEFKPVHTYVNFEHGLIIYDGLDKDYLSPDASLSPGTGTFHLARIWELELKQAWNPAGLLCAAPVVEVTITLSPASASLNVGQSHLLTATVRDSNNNPVGGVILSLEITGANSSNMSATTNSNGIVTFTYTANNAGNDSIIAKAGGSNSNAVIVHWNGAPEENAGPDQTVNTGTTVTLNGTGTTDPNPEDVLSYSWIRLSGPAMTLEGANTATPTFTPMVEDTYVFQLTVSDGILSDTDAVSIIVQGPPPNHAPVAQNQSIATDEDISANIILVATDIDNDSLTYSIASQPTHGTLSGSAPNLTYTPNAHYYGTDSFTFKANDGYLDSNIATVSITINPVNDAPVANNQVLSTNEDTMLNIILTASDVENDPLTYSIVTSPIHGALTGTPPNVVYTPASNYNGADSFTFKANDGQLNSNIATVSLTIIPVNDPPVANNQSVTTHVNIAVNITLVASDVDGDTLIYSIVANPAHGSITGTAPNLTYTPTTSYIGSDSFIFKANDGHVDSNIAMVSIIVLSAIGCPAPSTIDYKAYTAANCTVPQVYVAVNNQAELDAYEQNFGFDGTHVKNLHVNFNPAGNVVIISPCLIKLNGPNNYLNINADNVCIYGRKGVHVAEDYANPDAGITAGAIHLISEEAEAGFYMTLTIHAGEINVRAVKEAKLGMNFNYIITGPITAISTGNLTTSHAEIRQGTHITAQSITVEASRNAIIGPDTIINVSGAITVHSTGNYTESEAIAKERSNVTANTLSITSGNKSTLGPDSQITITGNFQMNAAAPNKCTISSGVVINAGSRSGNCL